MKKKIISLFALLSSDILVVFASFSLAYIIRSEILPHLLNKFRTIPLYPESHYLNQFPIAIIWIIVFAFEKLYTKRHPFWEEIKILLKSSTISFSLVMIMIFITKKQVQFSRTVVILAWFVSLLIFPLFRYITKILLIKTNLWKKKLIILGVQQTTLLILKSINKNRTMGYEVLGFLDDDPKKMGKKYLGVKVLGSFSDLENVTQTYKSKDIMIATPHLPRKELKGLLSKCESISESMWLIPRSGDFITEGVEIEILGEVLTLYIKKNLTKPWNILIKDWYEKTLTLCLIILLFPLFILISIAIKLNSNGPVIFVQKRLGKGNKVFHLYKFRSMFIDGDEKLEDFLNRDKEAKQEWETYKKLKNLDPRVTKVGKIIRKFSLDELPQLINILQGKMSLVGPRPYLPEELEGKEEFKYSISRIKPGITGLWQISGRSELAFNERLSIDEYYIRNWSLWLDATILLRSLKVFFSRKGAY